MLKAMAHSAMNMRSERDQKALKRSPMCYGALFAGAMGMRVTSCISHTILKLTYTITSSLSSVAVKVGRCLLKDGERRRIICYKALWAIESLAKPTYHSEPSPFSANFVRTYRPLEGPKNSHRRWLPP
ncbi:hypothetical protein B0H13DRAFT_2355478 [Mycena leptocephala]|nr:hypothetical protein B0H13DRAFT_2355478 [Mycena leptocephala]